MCSFVFSMLRKYCNWWSKIQPGRLWVQGAQHKWLRNVTWLDCVYEPRHAKINKMAVHPAKTQISLGIRPVWSESSLCTQRVAKGPSFLHVGSEDSDQTGRMPRLIWVFAGRTSHFVCFIMKRLVYIFVKPAFSLVQERSQLLFIFPDICLDAHPHSALHSTRVHYSQIRRSSFQIWIFNVNWAASSEFGTYRLCKQRRFRQACASVQSCQNLGSESRGIFRQKARSLAPLNDWACAVKICHDRMLEDTNSLDAAQFWQI